MRQGGHLRIYGRRETQVDHEASRVFRGGRLPLLKRLVFDILPKITCSQATRRPYALTPECADNYTPPHSRQPWTVHTRPQALNPKPQTLDPSSTPGPKPKTPCGSKRLPHPSQPKTLHPTLLHPHIPTPPHPIPHPYSHNAPVRGEVYANHLARECVDGVDFHAVLAPEGIAEHGGGPRRHAATVRERERERRAGAEGGWRIRADQGRRRAAKSASSERGESQCCRGERGDALLCATSMRE